MVFKKNIGKNVRKGCVFVESEILCEAWEQLFHNLKLGVFQVMPDTN